MRVHADAPLSFSGITLLHHAAAGGRLEICLLLVEAKADVGARTRCQRPRRAHPVSLTPCAAAAAAPPSTGPTVIAGPASLHIFAIAQRRCSDSLHVSHTVATTPATLEPRRARYKSIIIPQITANSAGRRACVLNSRLHSERLNKSTAQLQVACVRHNAVPACRRCTHGARP